MEVWLWWDCGLWIRLLSWSRGSVVSAQRHMDYYWTGFSDGWCCDHMWTYIYLFSDSKECCVNGQHPSLEAPLLLGPKSSPLSHPLFQAPFTSCPFSMCHTSITSALVLVARFTTSPAAELLFRSADINAHVFPQMQGKCTHSSHTGLEPRAGNFTAAPHLYVTFHTLNFSHLSHAFSLHCWAESTVVHSGTQWYTVVYRQVHKPQLYTKNTTKARRKLCKSLREFGFKIHERESDLLSLWHTIPLHTTKRDPCL